MANQVYAYAIGQDLTDSILLTLGLERIQSSSGYSRLKCSRKLESSRVI